MKKKTTLNFPHEINFTFIFKHLICGMFRTFYWKKLKFINTGKHLFGTYFVAIFSQNKENYCKYFGNLKKRFNTKF